MSGTSLDGVDAVLADFASHPRIIRTSHGAFPPGLRKTLLSLNEAAHNELHTAASAANDLASLFARSVEALVLDAGADAAGVVAIGCHGQTIRHNPPAGYSLQIVNGALLAELSGITVVSDFRSRDIAAGGQGAPLAPAFHLAVFHSRSANRAIVNIGGMANITYLPSDGGVCGFDCGPGNVLMDAWIHETRRQDYDANGAWAAEGHVLTALLDQLLTHAYFAERPPKSTGRETFNLDLIRRTVGDGERAVDVQATLLELTARTIAGAIEGECAKATEVYVCGGGARNATLMRRLSSVLPGKTIAPTDDLGIDAEWVEALAFAWLAQRAIKGEPETSPMRRALAGARVLGAIYRR